MPASSPVTMSVRVVRLGTPRAKGEGLRLGTVRRPPRGVLQEDWAARDYFDVWLPELAPSAPLVAYALSRPFTPARWAVYERRYRREMRQPMARRLIALLAALSSHTNVSVGCDCEDGSLLRGLLREHGADVV